MGRTRRGGQDLTEGLRVGRVLGMFFLWIGLFLSNGEKQGVICEGLYITLEEGWELTGYASVHTSFCNCGKNTMHNLDRKVAKWETIRTKAIGIFFKNGKAVCKCVFLARDNVGVAPRT